ncbi:HalOD1 output domain-containing protein [Halobellus ordinarius]|uniref:HalOD1 output domain-containing protein n=1 Tax=Halobellus ordinarius TaxID=3075120 RepID=UPI002880198D|nr:HalOD1 output domain-containing protein [Halobellus sp. ZY16]
MEYEIGAGESVSTAVVRAVSAVEGRDPRSLRPLADVFDPDALDTLFGSRGDGTPRPGGRLTFVYSKCCVTVDNGEYLTIDPIDPRIRDGRGPDVVDSGSR